MQPYAGIRGIEERAHSSGSSLFAGNLLAFYGMDVMDCDFMAAWPAGLRSVWRKTSHAVEGALGAMYADEVT